MMAHEKRTKTDNFHHVESIPNPPAAPLLTSRLHRLPARQLPRLRSAEHIRLKYARETCHAQTVFLPYAPDVRAAGYNVFVAR
jgi:hypothetical protein